MYIHLIRMELNKPGLLCNIYIPINTASSDLRDVQ